MKLRKYERTWKKRILALAVSVGMVVNSFQGLTSDSYYTSASDTDTLNLVGTAESVSAQLEELFGSEDAEVTQTADTQTGDTQSSTAEVEASVSETSPPETATPETSVAETTATEAEAAGEETADDAPEETVIEPEEDSGNIPTFEEMTTEKVGEQGTETSTELAAESVTEQVTEAAETSVYSEPEQDENGIWQIDSAEELFWLAEFVNAGGSQTDAVLTQDIVINERLCDESGAFYARYVTEDTLVWTPIGTAEHPYSGTFDGQGFSIRGMYLNDTSCDHVGLFGVVSGGTIRNLSVLDSVFNGGEYVGSVAGKLVSDPVSGNPSRIEQCLSNSYIAGTASAGGICGGLDAGCVDRCAYFSFIMLYLANSEICGTITEDGWMTDCYYLSEESSVGMAEHVAPKTEEQFASGEVAYFLGVRQNLEEDAYPTTDQTHSSVYTYTAACTGETVYTNDMTLAGLTTDHMAGASGECPLCTQDPEEEMESEVETETDSETAAETETELEIETESESETETESETQTESESGSEMESEDSTEDVSESEYEEDDICILSNEDEGISVQGITGWVDNQILRDWITFIYQDDTLYDRWLAENFNWQTDFISDDGYYYDWEYWSDQYTTTFLVCESDNTRDPTNIWDRGDYIVFMASEAEFNLNPNAGVRWDFSEREVSGWDGTSVFTVHLGGSVSWNDIVTNEWDWFCDTIYYSAEKLKNDKNYNTYRDRIRGRFNEYTVIWNVIVDYDFSVDIEENGGIGSVEHPFRGTFDGQGHEIYGSGIDGYSRYVGLIGVIGSKNYIGNIDNAERFATTTIKNVRIRGWTVKNYYGYKETNSFGTGALIGCVSDTDVTFQTELVTREYESTVIIENCHLEDCNITGGRSVGGFIGLDFTDNLIMRNCTSTNTNVTATNTINNGGAGDYDSKEAGGLIGDSYGNLTMINCSNTGGSVQAEYGNCGGLVAHGGNVDVSYCYNTATVSQEHSSPGGILGYADSGSVYMCYNVGDLYGSYSQADGIVYSTIITAWSNNFTVATKEQKIKVSYCYSKDGTSGIFDEVTYCGDDADFDYDSASVSGELCWMMNDCVSGGTNWKQQVGVEAYPTFSGDAAGRTVYSEIVCQIDGGEAREWNNSDEYEYYHDYDKNGFCVNNCCYDRKIADRFMPAEQDGSGWHQITNGGNLFWWIEQNDGTSDWNAVLTQDITVNENVLNASGQPTASSFKQDVALAQETTETVFCGTLNGDGYTISGIYDSGASLISSGGLFGVTNGAVIKDVTLKDLYCDFSEKYGTHYYGGILGYGTDTTITGCNVEGKINLEDGEEIAVTLGGLAGRVQGSSVITRSSVSGVLINQIQNTVTGGIAGAVYENAKVYDCYSTLDLTAGFISRDTVGGIAGAVKDQNSVTGCYNAGTVTAGTSVAFVGDIVPSTGNLRYTRCYYLAETENDTKGAKTAKQFASGEVTWLLNNEVTDGSQSWYQDIDNDKKPYDIYPVFAEEGSTVYAYGGKFCGTDKSYSNTKPSTGTTVVHDAHKYDEKGFCEYCGAYEPPRKGSSVYYISNAGQLYWYASMINGTLGQTCGDFDTEQHLLSVASIQNDIEVNEIALNENGKVTDKNGTVLTDTKLAQLRSWTPIAEQGSENAVAFSGMINGNGYTIRGLYYNGSADHVALVGAADSGSMIRNLNLEDSYFHGNEYTAAICGALKSGAEIDNVSVNMTVTGSKYVGGLAGSVKGSIFECFMDGHVSATGDGYAGGLAAELDTGAVVTYSRVLAEVSAKTCAGGIAGWNHDGEIRSCCNIGTVSGNHSIGGIVGGGSGGRLVTSYNYGVVTANDAKSDYVGGIAGQDQDDKVYIYKCYYRTGVVTINGTAQNGIGVSYGNDLQEDTAIKTIGKDTVAFASGEVTWLLDKATSGRTWYQDVDNGVEPYDPYPVYQSEGAIVYCNVQDCESPMTYTNTATGYETSGHTFDEKGICTRCKQYEPAILLNDLSDDTVDDDTPYEAYYGAAGIDLDDSYTGYYAVTNVGQLYWTALVVNGDLDQEDYPSLYHEQDTKLKIVLANDITDNENLNVWGNGIANNVQRDWIMYGKASGSVYFEGIFDGNGKSVSGLYKYDSNLGQATAFIALAKNCTVKNLTLKDSAFVGTYSGGIVGECWGDSVIADCHNEAMVLGFDTAGGIVTIGSSVIITRCSNSGFVGWDLDEYGSTGYDLKAGGIAGWLYEEALVKDCCNFGEAAQWNTSSACIGGLVGWVFEPSGKEITISDCYNYDLISGSQLVGSDGAIITNCYYRWDEETTETTAETTDGITVKTTAAFASGEVAYLLNGGKVEDGEIVNTATADGTHVWYQNLDNEKEVMEYPFFDGGTVYYGARKCGAAEKKYTNYYANAGGHVYENGFCQYCGEYERAELKNGYYEIGNAGQLYWFAALVNGTLMSDASNYEEQKVSAKGKLIADITDNDIFVSTDGSITGVNEDTRIWTPIGDYNVKKKFSGSLDGDGHSISGLYMDGTQEYAALIGCLQNSNADCIVQNVTVKNSYLEGKSYGAAMVGYASSNAIIKNCHNEALILFGEQAESDKKDECWGGGIVAYQGSDSVVIQCSNIGTVFGFGRIGGIVGFLSDNGGTRLQLSSHTGTAAGYGNVGGLAGNWDSGDIVQCSSTGDVIRYSYTTEEEDWAELQGVGGLIGCFSTTGNDTLLDCYYAGSITNEDGQGTAGYWIGTVESAFSWKSCECTIENCHNAAYLDGEIPYTNIDTLVTVTIRNSYYRTDDSEQDDGIDGTSPMSYEEFANGTVAYLLNGGVVNAGSVTAEAVTDGTQAWYQNLDNGAEPYDEYPVFEGGTVYYSAENCGGSDCRYTNTERGRTGHEYANGFCKYCDAYEPAVLMTSVDTDTVEDDTPYTAYFGTEDYGLTEEYTDYYVITNGGQLYWFAALVNREIAEESNEYTDAETHKTGVSAKAVLLNDITVNTLELSEDGTITEESAYAARSWTPIGSQRGVFTNRYLGIFDGNQKTIRGLYYDGENSYVALFGRMNSGTIRNVTLQESYFKGTSQTAGICAEVLENGTIENCTNGAVILATNSHAGGIVCNNMGRIEKCTNQGIVRSETEQELCYAGGIAAVNSGTILSGSNLQPVSSSDVAGGIAGNSEKGSLTSCTNQGTVSGNTAAGGITGISRKDTMSSCENQAKVEGKDAVGGIVGRSMESIMTGCSNTGQIRGRYAIGGVIGEASGLTMENCANYGTVSGMIAGGLTGCLMTGDTAENAIVKSYNEGKICYEKEDSTKADATDLEVPYGIGGLVGYVQSGSLEYVYHSGTVSAAEADSGYTGAMIGAVASDSENVDTESVVTVTDSYSYESGNAELVGTLAEAITFTNCYYRSETETESREGTTAKGTDAFTSGEVTWLLNGGMAQGDTVSEDAVWRQNLDNGAAKQTRPLYLGGLVYRVIDCTTDDVGGYSNSFVSSGHEFNEYGFCSKCDAYQPVRADEDGSYQIAKAGELFWIAAHVNYADPTTDPHVYANTMTSGIGTNITIVLKNDIDLSTGVPEGLMWTPLGRYSDISSYKSGNRQFTGTFDGNYHTVSGMTVSVSEPLETGFIGRAYKATIKNLGVSGTVENTWSGKISTTEDVQGVRTGILAGELYQCTVSYCYTAIPASYMDDTEEANEAEDAVKTLHTQKGGFAGEACESTIRSCYTQYGTFLGAGSKNPTSLTACYFVSAEESSESQGAQGLPKTAFTDNGKVTWLLNGGTANCNTTKEEEAALIWKQGNTSKWLWPGFSGSSIFLCYLDCAETDAKYYSYRRMPPDHSYNTDGFCSKCGAYEPAKDSDEDGVYEISNAGQLFWFAAHVNHNLVNMGDFSEITGITSRNVNPNVSYTTNAKLTKNIWMNVDEVEDGIAVWEPIGAPDRDYQAVFDGNGYEICEFSYGGCQVTNWPEGVFGYVKNGTVKNLSVDGTMSITQIDPDTSKNESFGVIGWTVGTTTIENVTSNLAIDFSGLDADVKHVGGIVGKAEGTLYISGCTYQSSITGSEDHLMENVGGILGTAAKNSKITMTDCTVKHINYNHYTELITAYDGRSLGGIIGIAEDYVTLTLQKCANYGTIQTNLTRERDCFGGIVAYTTPSTTYTFENCAFYGEIVNLGQGALVQVGGILGYHRDTSKNANVIRNCLSVGSIRSEAGLPAIKTGAIGGILNIDKNSGGIVLENNYYRSGMLEGLSDQAVGTGGEIGGTPVSVGGSTDAVIHTEEQLASGETTWLLNDGKPVDHTTGDEDEEEDATIESLIWHQTLTEDEYPYFEGGVVYKEDKTYLNERSGQFEHHYDEYGFCKDTHDGESNTCFTYEPAWKITDDLGDTLENASTTHKIYYGEVELDESYVGYYTPQNAGQLQWLSAHINYNNPVTEMVNSIGYACVRYETRNYKVGQDVKIVLTTDISTQEKPSYDNYATKWKPMGRYGYDVSDGTLTDRSFTGIFDGNHHTISVYVAKDEYTLTDYLDIGLFGRADGATIKNLGVKAAGSYGVYINASIVNEDATDEEEQKAYAGVLAGTLKNCTVSQCYAWGSIYNGAGNVCETGYFAAAAPGSKIMSCYAAYYIATANSDKYKYVSSTAVNFLASGTEQPASVKDCCYSLGNTVSTATEDEFGAVGLPGSALISGETEWWLNGCELDWTWSGTTEEAKVQYFWKRDLSDTSIKYQYPQFDGTEAVYLGYTNCSWTTKAFYNEPTAPAEHQFRSYYCSVCKALQPAVLVTDLEGDTESDDTPYTANYQELDLDERYVGYYAIKNLGQYMWFAAHVNHEDPTQQKYYYKSYGVVSNTWDRNAGCQSNAVLITSRYLTIAESVECIGNSEERAYSGIFDGQGKNLSWNANVSTGNAVGIFGYAKNAVIRNLVSNYQGTIKISGNVTALGGIIGCAIDQVTVENVDSCVSITVDSSFTGSICYVGGIVGYSRGSLTMKNCTYAKNGFYETDVSITIPEANQGSYIGGILGYAGGVTEITNCWYGGNPGAVSEYPINAPGSTKVGGIVGGAEGASIVIRECASFGKINAADSVGGILGCASENTKIEVTDSAFYGILSSSGALRTGGMLGFGAGGVTTLQNCLSIGQISSSGGTVGALAGTMIGSAETIAVENCYYRYDSDTSCTAVSAVGVENTEGRSIYVPEETMEEQMQHSEEELASGKTGYLLNGQKNGTGDEVIWKQNDIQVLDNMSAPTFEGTDIVYRALVDYDIIYGGAEFVYQSEVWNAKTHQYEGCWESADSEGTFLEVKNQGVQSLSISIQVIQAHEVVEAEKEDDGVDISLINCSWLGGGELSGTDTVILGSMESLSANTAVSGIPNEYFDWSGNSQQLATVTIGIGVASDE